MNLISCCSCLNLILPIKVVTKSKHTLSQKNTNAGLRCRQLGSQKAYEAKNKFNDLSKLLPCWPLLRIAISVEGLVDQITKAVVFHHG